MQRHGTFDGDGFPTGFYVDTLHGENIPDAAVEITDAQWREFTRNQGRRALVNGAVVIKTPTVVTPTATEMLDDRLARDLVLNALVETVGGFAGQTVDGVKATMVTKIPV